MIDHWGYLRYVARHKWYVLLGGLKTGAPLWRLLVHDLSKFRPSEWFPYAAYFFGGEQTPARKEAFQRAWLRHIHRNDHHPEHYILVTDRGSGIQALAMPEAAVRELVADWYGAARAQGGDLGAWYRQHRTRLVLHDETRRRIEHLLATCFQIGP